MLVLAAEFAAGWSINDKNCVQRALGSQIGVNPGAIGDESQKSPTPRRRSRMLKRRGKNQGVRSDLKRISRPVSQLPLEQRDTSTDELIVWRKRDIGMETVDLHTAGEDTKDFGRSVDRLTYYRPGLFIAAA